MIRLAMGERDVANATLMEMPQVRQVSLQRRAVLHAHRQRHHAFFEVPPDIRRGRGDGELPIGAGYNIIN